jgi:hypothetical protein
VSQKDSSAIEYRSYRVRRAEGDGEEHETDKSVGSKKTEVDRPEGQIKEVNARVFDPLPAQATNALVSIGHPYGNSTPMQPVQNH